MQTAPGSGPGDRSETVGDVVYGRLRADILFGHLRPGERLRLDQASRRYGVSIGTIRELLCRLSSERLVVAEPQRGFEVAPASISDFREIAAMRELLEQKAMALSFAAGDLDWEGRIVAAQHKLAVMEQRVLSGHTIEPEKMRRLDFAFHQALISACGSTVLLQTHRAMHDRFFRYVNLAAVFRGPQSTQEHAALLDHALARNIPAAEQTLSAHLAGCIGVVESSQL